MPQVWSKQSELLAVWAILTVLVVSRCLLDGCAWSSRVAAGEPTTVLEPLPRVAPAPEGNPTTPAKAALGKQLFFDPRLSGDNTLACSSCHVPQHALADGRDRARGRGDQRLDRNTPSLWNIGFQSTFFWDGRAASLEEQALHPIQDDREMHQDLDELEEELGALPGYVVQFKEVFGTGVTREGIAQALAAFQRTLITEPSPLDRYLNGEKRALSKQARRGLEIFVGEAGCVTCHHGPLLTDGKFYRLGLPGSDEGRAAITGRKEDRGRFRTPSLRNVAQTAPYMHDGSQATLEQVVAFYLRGVPSQAPGGLALDVQPLLHLSYSEISPLAAFLHALTGEVPEITPPELP